MIEEVAAALGGGGVTAVVIYILRSILFRALEDMKRQLTPNGGNSVHDLARKTVEVTENIDARVKILETKVDALILSRIQDRG
jgi:hypothetical protein